MGPKWLHFAVLFFLLGDAAPSAAAESEKGWLRTRGAEFVNSTRRTLRSLDHHNLPNFVAKLSQAADRSIALVQTAADVANRRAQQNPLLQKHPKKVAAAIIGSSVIATLLPAAGVPLGLATLINAAQSVAGHAAIVGPSVVAGVHDAREERLNTADTEAIDHQPVLQRIGQGLQGSIADVTTAGSELLSELSESWSRFRDSPSGDEAERDHRETTNNSQRTEHSEMERRWSFESILSIFSPPMIPVAP